MSYSFNVRAANKAEAKAKVARQLAAVVETQPIHAADKDQAQAAAEAFIDLLHDDEGMEVNVVVNGSLGWRGQIDSPEFSSSNVSVSAYLAKPMPPAT
jgi:hypothetical protein